MMSRSRKFKMSKERQGEIKEGIRRALCEFFGIDVAPDDVRCQRRVMFNPGQQAVLNPDVGLNDTIHRDPFSNQQETITSKPTLLGVPVDVLLANSVFIKYYPEGLTPPLTILLHQLLASSALTNSLIEEHQPKALNYSSAP
jgi:hypothetical protein